MPVLIHGSGKRVYYSPEKPEIHTEYGKIMVKDINIGSAVKSHIGEKFVATEPAICDIVEGFRMASRPIYYYDAGMICGLLDVRPGARVLEAGTGSGGMSVFMARNCGANVITYEREERFYEIAKHNLSKYPNIDLRLGDVLKAVHGTVFAPASLESGSTTPPKLRRAWQRLQGSVEAFANAITFQQLLEESTEKEKMYYI